MSRRTLNRRELRVAAEAAEAAESVGDGEAADADEEVAKPAAKKAAAPKKRKSRAKADKVVRYKAFWGVFNQSLKRVALFEFHQRSDAEKKVEELNAAQKSPHFVRPVKEPIEE